MRNQLFIYGSCVARDIVRVTNGRYGLVHYVARQSWISAATKSLPRPKSVTLSPFGARSLSGDFSSNLPYLLRKKASQADAIVIDIASDRHGVYPLEGGYISNTGELKRAGIFSELATGRLVTFGTSEHRRLFRIAAAKIKRVLIAAELFERTVILNVPFTGRSVDGTEVPLARGLTALEVNRTYAPYYKMLSDLGFAMIEWPPSSLIFTTTDHKWGISQDHFIDETYY